MFVCTNKLLTLSKASKKKYCWIKTGDCSIMSMNWWLLRNSLDTNGPISHYPGIQINQKSVKTVHHEHANNMNISSCCIKCHWNPTSHNVSLNLTRYVLGNSPNTDDPIAYYTVIQRAITLWNIITRADIVQI